VSGVHRFGLGETVSEGQRAYFEEYGFIVFAGVFSRDEVAVIREDAEVLATRTLADEIPASDVDDLTPRSRDERGNELLHRLPYFTRYSPRTRALVDTPRLHALGRALVGEQAWLLEDTLHGVIWQMKYGGRDSAYSEIRWHVDFRDDHLLAPVVSAGIYLDESTSENGCLAVVPASHRFPPRRLPPVPVLVEARPGDVVCHAHDLLHGSGPVRRDGSRRATLYLYFCGGAYPGPDLPFAGEEAKREIKKLFVGTGSGA